MIDKKRGWPVTQFRMDSHLKRDAVGGADGMGRIEKERVSHVSRREINILKEIVQGNINSTVMTLVVSIVLDLIKESTSFISVLL